MRVLCSTIDGNDVEGEVIWGKHVDPETGEYDLYEMFRLRCDDGAVFEVPGWLVDITRLDMVPCIGVGK